MSRSARDSSAARALLARVEERATGKLAVGAGAVEVAVHLMAGEILAATAADDNRQLVRMAALHELLSMDQADALEDHIEQGHDVFGDLLDATSGAELDQILRERFWQNLCEFVSSVSTVRFYEQKGLFVENIQMGHESRALIEEVCGACDRAVTLDLDELVVRGAEDPGDDPLRTLVADLLGPDPRTVSSLLHEVPLEPTRARLLIAELISEGVARPESVAPPPETREVEPEMALTPSAEPMDDFGEDEPTHHEVSDVPVGDDLDDGDDGAPRSLATWLEAASSVTSEEDLDFFSDHDIDRSAGGDGAFSTEKHHRDLVEVAELGASSQALEVLEADEAPAVRFGAPVLSEHEAMSKLEVANQVLSTVAQAFDQAEGAGRGRALVQLLVDGGPSRYASLMQDLEVSEIGALPGEVVLRNLYGRPPTEHRQLLHNTLVDIIERALSSAADELPEENFDHVLESVAGYRQRLGL